MRINLLKRDLLVQAGNSFCHYASPLMHEQSILQFSLSATGIGPVSSWMVITLFEFRFLLFLVVVIVVDFNTQYFKIEFSHSLNPLCSLESWWCLSNKIRFARKRFRAMFSIWWFKRLFLGKVIRWKSINGLFFFLREKDTEELSVLNNKKM